MVAAIPYERIERSTGQAIASTATAKSIVTSRGSTAPLTTRCSMELSSRIQAVLISI